MNSAELAPVSDLHFRFMNIALKLRDIFKPPKKVLKEAGIKAGDTVLDFGCGPGSYSLAAAGIVGEKGQIYALDIHPMAIKSVRQQAKKKRLKNIIPVFSDVDTGFSDKCMDAVLLYDVFHEIGEPEKYLAEFFRVLKRDGIISLHDHHLKNHEIISGLTKGGYFQLSKKGKKTYIFTKVKN
jgi:ubiquinone/menaquinone biosynthesis C-methylase UbiE